MPLFLTRLLSGLLVVLIHESICPFSSLFVCVGGGPALVERSITQRCCWLLKLISPSLCLSLSLSCLLWAADFLIILLFNVFCAQTDLLFHFPSPFLSSTLSFPHSLSFIFFDPSLWISGRVWLWFRDQSQASWFHVVTHLSSQCLVRHVHILLQGKIKHESLKMYRIIFQSLAALSEIIPSDLL